MREKNVVENGNSHVKTKYLTKLTILFCCNLKTNNNKCLNFNEISILSFSTHCIVFVQSKKFENLIQHYTHKFLLKIFKYIKDP